MQKIFTFLFLIIAISLFSQEEKLLTDTALKPKSLPKDTSWKKSGFAGLNASQTSLSNWQGGGQDNIAINSILNLQAIHTKKKHQWTSKLDAQFGLAKTGDFKLFQKNLDQLFALSKFDSHAFGKDWFYVIQADFRSQFAPGYNYSGDSIIGRATSGFFSPAYIQIALGLDFKPVDYFSITLAPAAGKITVVSRQYLADEGAYGVEKAVLDSSGNIIKHGKRARYEFGGRIIVRFKKDIFKNVNFDSYLDLFSNYFHNPQNIDIVFNNLLTFKINKYLTANVICQMIYDDDIIIKRDWNKDGKYDNKNDINGPRLQVISTFALGLGYKF